MPSHKPRLASPKETSYSLQNSRLGCKTLGPVLGLSFLDMPKLRAAALSVTGVPNPLDSLDWGAELPGPATRLLLLQAALNAANLSADGRNELKQHI